MYFGNAAQCMQGTNWQAAKFQYESNIMQLREASEAEAVARRAVEADKQAAQVEVDRLSGTIGGLNEEIDSLRDTVSHLGESLANALAMGPDAADEKSEMGERVDACFLLGLCSEQPGSHFYQSCRVRFATVRPSMLALPMLRLGLTRQRPRFCSCIQSGWA